MLTLRRVALAFGDSPCLIYHLALSHFDLLLLVHHVFEAIQYFSVELVDYGQLLTFQFEMTDLP